MTSSTFVVDSWKMYYTYLKAHVMIENLINICWEIWTKTIRHFALVFYEL